MLELDGPRDLLAYVGKPLGASDWLTVDQKMIDAFAHATDDLQWIHIDTERAKREMPGGKTIAHGFLTLSLLPRLARSVVSVKSRSRTLNYGSNKVRFTAPVPSGARIRLKLTLKSAEPVEGGMRLIYDNLVEVEGSDKPALVAETIQVTYL
jgi:acyl dehydratase